MTRTWTVYALSDPETLLIRYVGVTNQNMTLRLAGHLCKAARGRTRTHCACWIRSLLRKSLRPTWCVLETGGGDGWAAAERKWIAHFRSAGAPLTNHTDGGEGTLGWNPSVEWRRANALRAVQNHTGRKRSAETRARMTAAQHKRVLWEREQGIKRVHPPRSEKTLQQMSEAQRGKKASPETRQRLSEIHRDPNSVFQSPEYKARMREAVLKRPLEQQEAFAHNQKGKSKSEEHRRKIAEAHRGKKLSEETKQRLREANLGRTDSVETRKKKGEASRAAWAKRKAAGSNTDSSA